MVNQHSQHLIGKAVWKILPHHFNRHPRMLFSWMHCFIVLSERSRACVCT